MENTIVQPLLVNSQKVTQDVRVKVLKGLEHQCALADQILELTPITNLQSREQQLPQLFRMRSPLGFNMFERQFNGNPVLGRMYPFLAIFIKHHVNLANLCHISPMLDWLQILWSDFFLTIERNAALNMTVRDALLAKAKSTATTSTSSSSNSTATGNQAQSQQAFMTAFTRFSSAWNAVRHHVTRFECKELPHVPEELTLDSSFALCCPDADDPGIYFTAILYYLVHAQTDFLEDVFQLLEKTTNQQSNGSFGHSSSSTSHQQEISCIRWRPSDEALDIRSVKPSQLCSLADAQFREMLDYCGVQSIVYGKEGAYMFNFPLLEKTLSMHLVVGKTRLMDLYPTFLYKYELRRANALSDVALKVEQVALTDHQINTITNNAERQQVSNMITTLGIALGFLRQLGGNPNMELSYFLQTVLRLPPHQTAIWSSLSCLSGIRLKHVLSLYQALEDDLLEVLVDTCHSNYTESIPTDCGILEQLSVLVNQHVPPQPLVMAMGRLLCRRLTGRDLSAELELGDFLFSEWCNCTELWNMNSYGKIKKMQPPSRLGGWLTAGSKKKKQQQPEKELYNEVHITEDQLEKWHESAVFPKALKLKHVYHTFLHLSHSAAVNSGRGTA
eukprot:TRINITY_DN3745_c0_g1_i1.p1 TRINITY_DN3745_c0_g1~~TRINITY_DN3745_c0_g1_i1.p1  ORF type:complete len:658 (-),score=77.13 TRINITY_DN3745_c0_g1_i1:32-1882(-)